MLDKDLPLSQLEPMAEYARRRGMDGEQARVDARLAVAVSRGLLDLSQRIVRPE